MRARWNPCLPPQLLKPKPQNCTPRYLMEAKSADWRRKFLRAIRRNSCHNLRDCVRLAFVYLSKQTAQEPPATAPGLRLAVNPLTVGSQYRRE